MAAAEPSERWSGGMYGAPPLQQAPCSSQGRILLPLHAQAHKSVKHLERGFLVGAAGWVQCS